MPLDTTQKPSLVRVDEDGDSGNPVFVWRYTAPDGFWVEFRSGSHHLGGYQEYILINDNGSRAFVWGADTSILHTYLPELGGGTWEVELAYPTHFQVSGYNEDFSVVDIHRELATLFYRGAKDFATPEEALPVATLP
jgi:hypothetical protein